jgi:hypothetical protein
MGAEWLWPIIAGLAWCFGFCAGIAWCAQWRPVRVEIITRVMRGDADD